MGRGHRPGSAGSKQRGTEGQARGDGQERAGIRAGEVCSSGSDQAGSAKEQKQYARTDSYRPQAQTQLTNGSVCKSGP
ncbi:unnamed protein product, partial [Staurois parvus]